MINLRIKVTKQILEESKYCKPAHHHTSCAIALSIRSLFPKARVSSKDIFFNETGQCYSPLPSIAQEFIRAFDVSSIEQRATMDEIEFEVHIPDEVIENINIEELKPLLQNHPTLELIEN